MITVVTLSWFNFVETILYLENKKEVTNIQKNISILYLYEVLAVNPGFARLFKGEGGP